MLLYNGVSTAKGDFAMPGYVLTNFLVYALVNAFTPGPGNILALNTVTNYGWKKGKPLFWGIFTGYYAVQIICAVFVFGVGTFLPNALRVMKYIGAAYILWLAIHIGISKPEVGQGQGSASFMKGFLLQFVNIKIYMFGITALTGFITPYSKALWVLIGFELLIATIGTIATTTWIAAGLLIQKFYLKHFRVINIILALTLLECIWSILKS
jgi:cysteine/O-acetylserine efflux protein